MLYKLTVQQQAENKEVMHAALWLGWWEVMVSYYVLFWYYILDGQVMQLKL